MYINLFTKTEYSCLDSLIKLEDYISYAKEQNLDTLAICDNNLSGSYKFYTLCKKANINPVIGLEVNVHTGLGNVTKLLLFAKNGLGYHNLIKISSMIELSSNYSISYTDLLSFKQGLRVVTTDASDILRDYNKSLKFVEKYRISFEEFYLGVDPTDDYKANLLLELASMSEVKPVLIHETKYFKSSDYDYYLTLVAIKEGIKKSDVPRRGLDNYYLLEESPKVDSKLYENTLIFKDTAIDIDDHSYKLPNYDTKYDKKEYLKALALKGLEKRLRQDKNNHIDPYIERLARELKVIDELHYNDYFLIVYDFVLHAKRDLDILVGPGRGSAAGSLVSYCLGITNVDPLKYGLVFERFLNKDRVSMPDIDIDLPDDRRSDVINYLIEKYGKERVTLIQTFNRFLGKSSLRDVARVLNMPQSRVDEVIKECSDLSNLEEIISKPHVGQLIQENDDIYELFRYAKKIEGLIKSTSTHAAGVIISDKDITEYVPICHGVNNMNQIQFDASEAERIGLLKMDLLSLRNLSIIRHTVDLVNARYHKKLDLYNLDLKDERTYHLLQTGSNLGIFQLESRGISSMVKQLQITKFEDIALCLALYRPGPMDSIPELIKRKKTGEVTYLHPDLKDILGETYGFILYQEQIIKILSRFGQFKLSEADVIRKAISKKNMELMMTYKDEFIRRGSSKYDVNLLTELYDSIVKFASYGFNKSHAVSYAFITYYTAYLKANYPKEYLGTIIEYGGGKLTEEYKIDLLKMGIGILKPDINHSGLDYLSVGNNMLMPLTSINTVNESIANKLILERETNGEYISLLDFLGRTGSFLSDKVKEKIIYSGALDSFGFNKATLINGAKNADVGTKYLKQDLGILPETFIKEQEEFSFDTLQIKEKESINLNISYNFLAKYGKIIRGQNLNLLDDLKSLNTIKVLAKLVGLRKIKTKTNQDMAFIDIEDNTGYISVTVFPNNFRVYEPILRLGECYVFELTKEVTNNKTSVILNVLRVIKGEQ